MDSIITTSNDSLKQQLASLNNSYNTHTEKIILFTNERIKAQITRSLIRNNLASMINTVDDLVLFMIEISLADSVSSREEYEDIPPWMHYTIPAAKHNSNIITEDLYQLFISKGFDNFDEIEAFIIESSKVIDDTLNALEPNLYNTLIKDMDVGLLDSRSVFLVLKT